MCSPFIEVSNMYSLKNDWTSDKKRWLKILRDYDTCVFNHLGKANVVVDVLSRILVHVEDEKKELVWDVHRLAQ